MNIYALPVYEIQECESKMSENLYFSTLKVEHKKYMELGFDLILFTCNNRENFPQWLESFTFLKLETLYLKYFP